MDRIRQIDKRLLTILLIVFVQMLGAAMILPILPLYAKSEFNMTPQVITLLNTAFFGAQFVAGPYLGRLSDKHGRVPVLILSQIGTAVSFFMLAFAPNVAVLFLARILDGITGGNIIVAQAYITDVTPRERRTEALGYVFAIFGLGFIFGPILGGTLAAAFGLAYLVRFHSDLPFFVEVERLRDPALVGRPVAVGGRGPRGVIASASYEAREFGVKSAQPTSTALRLCPGLIVVAPAHGRYGDESARVFAIFRSVTPLVEGLSLDEAFLDVSGLRHHFESPVDVGEVLRRRIRDELGLPASVGVASTKFVAKLASEAAKPRATPQGPRAGPGVVVVEPGDELRFLLVKPGSHSPGGAAKRDPDAVSRSR